MIGGRLDKDTRAADALDKAELREAYERGRRDERAARRRRPLLMTVTFLLALVGVALLALAAVNGSFTRAGGVVDEHLSVAADRAGPALNQAATNAGQSLRNAAQTSKSKGENAG
jgi:hypothetical protein